MTGQSAREMAEKSNADCKWLLKRQLVFRSERKIKKNASAQGEDDLYCTKKSFQITMMFEKTCLKKHAYRPTD